MPIWQGFIRSWKDVDFTKEQLEHNISPDLLETFDKRKQRAEEEVKAYIREKRQKNEFEITYLNYYDWFYCSGQKGNRMPGKRSGYRRLMEQAIMEGSVCHGNYTYHNIIMLRE